MSKLSKSDIDFDLQGMYYIDVFGILNRINLVNETDEIMNISYDDDGEFSDDEITFDKFLTDFKEWVDESDTPTQYWF